MKFHVTYTETGGRKSPDLSDIGYSKKHGKTSRLPFNTLLPVLVLLLLFAILLFAILASNYLSHPAGSFKGDTTTLEITANTKARIFVDSMGNQKGNTPTTISIEPGKHKIIAITADGQRQTQEIEITAGDQTTINFNFQTTTTETETITEKETTTTITTTTPTTLQETSQPPPEMIYPTVPTTLLAGGEDIKPNEIEKLSANLKTSIQNLPKDRRIKLKEELTNIKNRIQRDSATWKAEYNPKFILSDEEKKRLCGLKPPENIQKTTQQVIQPSGIPAVTGYAIASSDSPILPAFFDWRNQHGQNYITPIKDQLNCGSCWAFGAVGTLEGAINAYYNNPSLDVDLAEQDLVSCYLPNVWGWPGCSGAYDYEIEYIFSNYSQSVGIPPESCFPYTASNSDCSLKCAGWQNQNWRIVSYENVMLTQEAIKRALIEHGPVEVGMEVYGDFFSYAGGIYQHISGGLGGYHAVAIVGYGVYDGRVYWIVKNSWGTEWGEGGYFRILAGECGIDSWFAYAAGNPIAPTPQPKLCNDNDGDGYCNWGLGSKPPAGCPACSDTVEDCDDGNASLYKTCGKIPQGTLNVTSQPSNADVYVKDLVSGEYTYRGKTPLVFPLNPGDRNVNLTMLGCDDYTQNVTVQDNQQTNMAVTLNGCGVTRQEWDVNLIGFDYGRDVVVSNDGSIYIAGYSQYISGERNDKLTLLKFDDNGILQWYKLIGNGYYCRGYGVAVDEAGFIYVTGETEKGAGQPNSLWLLKFDSSGKVIWNRTIGTQALASGKRVLSNGGYVYVTGYNVPSYPGNSGAWLLKFNPNGDLLWNQTIADKNGGGDGRSISIAGDGSIYVTGSFGTLGGWSDVWLLKFDSGGHIIWNRTYGGNESDIGEGIAVADDGSVYVTGSTMSYGPNEDPKHYNLLLIKFDADGNIIWNKTLGNQNAPSQGMDVAVSPEEGVYVIGSNANDLWMLKFNPDGDLLWNFTAGGPGHDQGRGLDLYKNHTIFATGSTRTYTYDDVWLLKVTDIVSTTTTTTTTTSTLPDLIVEDIMWNFTWVPGSTMFSTKVKNIGAGTAGSIRCKLTISSIQGATYSITPVNSLSPGSSVVMQFGGLVIAPGTYNLTVLADAEYLVTESNEFNNAMQKQMIVPTTTSSSTTTTTLGLISYWKFDEGSGTIAGDSADSNPGTVYGASWTPQGRAGGALGFDGTTNMYVKVNNNSLISLPGSFTYSAWIKPNAIMTAAYMRILARKNYNFEFAIKNNNNYLAFYDKLSWRYATSNTITFRQWNHVAITWNGTSYTVYSNGVGNVVSGSTPSNIDDLYIGNSYVNDGRFNGSIDEVRIYNRALTPTEILNLYNSMPTTTTTSTTRTTTSSTTTTTTTTSTTTTLGLPQTGLVDPNGDWPPMQLEMDWPGPTHTSAINDGVRYPSTSGFNGYYIQGGIDGGYDSFDMSTINMGGGTAKSINIFAYCLSGPNDGQAPNNWNVAVSTDGVNWASSKTINCGTTYGWGSATFTGTWTQAQIDTLKVRVLPWVPDYGYVQLEELYAAITYSGGIPTITTTLPPAPPTTTTLRPTTTTTLGAGSCKPFSVDCRYFDPVSCNEHSPCCWHADSGSCWIDCNNDHFTACMTYGGSDQGSCNNHAICQNSIGSSDCWNCQWNDMDGRCVSGNTCTAGTAGPAGAFTGTQNPEPIIDTILRWLGLIK